MALAVKPLIFVAFGLYHRRSLSNHGDLLRISVAVTVSTFILVLGLLVLRVIGFIMDWNFIGFGTFIPVSRQIKQWRGTMNNTVYAHKETLESFLGVSRVADLGAWHVAANSLHDLSQRLVHLSGVRQKSLARLLVHLMPYWMLGLSLLLVWVGRKRLVETATRLGILPLFTAAFFQFACFKATDYVYTRSWYWIAATLCSALLIVTRIDFGVGWLKQKRVPAAVFWLAALALMVGMGRGFLALLPRHFPMQEKASTLSVMMLEMATEPGSRIGSTGGGKITDFIQDRTIVNLDGLMNSSEYFRRMKAGEATSYLDEIGLNYVYGNKYMLTVSDPYGALFAGRLGKIGYSEGSVLFAYLRGDEETTLAP